MSVGPRRPRRTLIVLCLASAAWAFGFGLGAPLAALWMHDAGWGGRVVGLNTCVYYLGAALGALAAPRLMRRAGSWCVTGGILVDALSTALFPWAPGLAGWFLLRLLSGVGGGLCLIPMETLVNRNAPPERRRATSAPTPSAWPSASAWVRWPGCRSTPGRRAWPSRWADWPRCRPPCSPITACRAASRRRTRRPAAAGRASCATG